MSINHVQVTAGHVAHFDRTSGILLRDVAPKDLPKAFCDLAQYAPIEFREDKMGQAGLPEINWGSWIPKWLARAIELNISADKALNTPHEDRTALQAEFDLNAAEAKKRKL